MPSHHDAFPGHQSQELTRSPGHSTSSSATHAAITSRAGSPNSSSALRQTSLPSRSAKVVPSFDQQEIDGLQDWRQRILQGLRESRLLLAFLSPAYLESEYCEWELVEFLKFEIGHLHSFSGVASRRQDRPRRTRHSHRLRGRR